MKTNKVLGQKVQKHLQELGIETPMSINQVSEETKMSTISSRMFEIMGVLGLDLSDDSLTGTPGRVAKMFVKEIFSGLNYDTFPECTAVSNKMDYDQMVVVSGIDVSSTCEHHFVVIDGFAKVAYIPKDKVIGLSKINRLVKFFSKRPQIQERLTEQIAAALQLILGTEDVAVEIRAKHFCVKARGVEDANSYTTTKKLGGVFMENEVRNEFLQTK